MKKPVRLLLLGAVVVAMLLLVAVGLALHSGVQTWAARRALTGQPQWKATLGRVSAGMRTVALHDLHLEQDGAVLTLPSLAAEFSVIDAALHEKIHLRRLVAKGWTLDLTAARLSTAVAPNSAALAAAAAPAVAAQVFQGIFARAPLPFDLTLDGVELEGEVKLPPAPGVAAGHAHVLLKGGGLAAGREGTFTFTVAVALTGADLPVSSLTITGRLTAAMDTSRTFSRLGTQASASAIGPQFPGGVKLTTDVTATRASSGERYALSLSDGTRPLASLRAELPAATRHIAGTWQLDVRDTDLAPFTLGRPLPAFAVVGAGGLAFEIATAAVSVTGKLAASADKLGVVLPELAALGAVKLAAEFDLSRRGDTLRIERLSAALSGARPVATVQSLQSFEFNAKTGELKVADPARELLGLVLQGLPLSWAQPFLKDFTVTGDDLRGEFIATARNGGFALRPKAPLTVAGVSLAQAGKPLLRAVDFSMTPSADYTPQGWQAELAPLTAGHGGVTLLTLEAKAGQLPGPDQPIKATGKLSAPLAGLLTQPAAAGTLLLTAGDATIEFVASLGTKQEIQAQLALSNLAADPKITKETLPTITAGFRADLTAGGPITLSLPVVIERAGRTSDLTLSGTLTPGKLGYALAAHVASALFVVDDAQILAAVLAPTGATKPVVPDPAPPWAGVSGQLTLAFKKVVYSDTFQVSDVSGTLSLDAGAAKLVNVRAGLGEGAEAKLNGGVTFDAQSATPYALAADLAVTEFDPATLFRALNPGEPATVEGRFSVVSKLAGRAATLGDFATAAHGDFQLTSKSGVFRGLPVSYAAKIESAGKIAAGAAAIGNLIGSVTGRKEAAEIANKAQAVSEFSKLLGAITYDQLNVAISRDAALNTVLKDFTLIAPELRLSGGGEAAHRPGAGLLEQPVALEFKLRARGHTADLLKYLGALEPPADDLGYAGCALPLRVGGTLGRPDTSELNRRLASLALEKSGMTEKASELFNKLLGGGK